jgi:hypothetical protein
MKRLELLKKLNCLSEILSKRNFFSSETQNNELPRKDKKKINQIMFFTIKSLVFYADF